MNKVLVLDGVGKTRKQFEREAGDALASYDMLEEIEKFREDFSFYSKIAFQKRTVAGITMITMVARSRYIDMQNIIQTANYIWVKTMFITPNNVGCSSISQFIQSHGGSDELITEIFNTKVALLEIGE